MKTRIDVEFHNGGWKTAFRHGCKRGTSHSEKVCRPQPELIFGSTLEKAFGQPVDAIQGVHAVAIVHGIDLVEVISDVH